MLLALGITKPVIRTVIILQIIQLNCNLFFLLNIICNYKVKRSIFILETQCLKATSTEKNKNKKKPKPNHFFFKTHRQIFKAIFWTSFFFEKGEGSSKACNRSVLDRKTNKKHLKVKICFFKSD